MLFSVLITIPILVAAVLTLLIALSTAFFMARVPTGPDAMALAAPALASGAAWILTLLAAWACTARGGLDWISTKPFVAVLVSTGVIIGLAVIGFGAFALWTERSSRVPHALLPVAGTVMPLVLLGLLTACAWANPQSLAVSVWPRVVGVPLGALAIIGLGVGGTLLVRYERGRMLDAAAVMAKEEAESAERQRRRDLPRKDRVTADMAAMPEGSPLWTISGALLGETDPECQRIIMARAGSVKDLDQQVVDTLGADFASVRGGAAEFVQLSESVRPEWSAGIAKAMDLLAQDIVAVGGMKSERYQDQYEVEIDRMIAAARRFPETDFRPQLNALRAAVEKTPPSEARTHALESLK